MGFSIKSGFLHRVDDFNLIKNLDNKVFFPGEIILNQIEIDKISLCQIEKNESFSQLLIRPINIYEVSYSREYKTKIEKNFQKNKLVNLTHNVKYPYNSGERIKTSGQTEILNQFLSFKLKNTNIQSCFLVKKNQFIDKYSTLGFLETSTLKSLEIVKLKSKRKKNRQLFLISNEDCIKLQKKEVKNKKIKDFIFDNTA